MSAGSMNASDLTVDLRLELDVAHATKEVPDLLDLHPAKLTS